MTIPKFFLRSLACGLLVLATAIAASPVAAQTVPVEFKNNSGGTVNLFLLDSNNNNAELPGGAIEAGDEGSAQVNVGDTLVVRDLAGREVGRYRVTKAETFQIGGGGGGGGGGSGGGAADGTRVFRVRLPDVNDRLKLTAPGVPNLDQDSLLFVSQVRTNAGANPSVLPVPFSLSYVNNLGNQAAFWTVSPQNGGIPAGCEFNVFVATPEVAFRHQEVTGGAPISYFNHQLVNGQDGVIVFVNKVVAAQRRPDASAGNPLGRSNQALGRGVHRWFPRRKRRRVQRAGASPSWMATSR